METALVNYKELKPFVDDYIQENGEQITMANLKGTVPVPINGVTYNIPLRIWLYKEHPQRPPLVYVDPTADMQIQSSRYVDLAGRVYHPYLANWSATAATPSSITDFVMAITTVFSAQSPVYAKAAPPPPPPVPDRRSPVLSDEVLRMSCLQTNTDNIKRQLTSLHKKYEDRGADMMASRERLLMGAHQLDKMASDMREQQRMVDTTVAALLTQRAPLENALAEMGGTGVIDVDDVITATAPVYNQLLELLAQDNALDDTMYHLTSALRNRQLKQEVYLKKVAELARVQFEVRALILKVRQVAGMPE